MPARDRFVPLILPKGVEPWGSDASLFDEEDEKRTLLFLNNLRSQLHKADKRMAWRVLWAEGMAVQWYDNEEVAKKAAKILDTDIPIKYMEVTKGHSIKSEPPSK